MKKRLLNSLLYIGLVSISFMMFSGNVYAKTLTIDEVVTEFKNIYNTYSKEYTLNNDTTNKVITITVNGNSYNLIKYTDEYLYFEDRDTEITSSSVITNEYYVAYTNYFFKAITNLSGYNSYSLTGFDDLDNDVFINHYDVFGITRTFEDKELTSGTTVTNESYLRYFKASFDTDKIAELYSNYGVIKLETSSPFYNLVPKLEVSDSSKTSITIKPSVDYKSYVAKGNDGLFVNKYVKCELFRSDSETGEYKSIATDIKCDGNNTYEDKDLEEGKTYYYKAILTDTRGASEATVEKVYSDILKTSTKVDETVATNPKTGSYMPYILVLLLALISYISLININKKKLFKKI